MRKKIARLCTSVFLRILVLLFVPTCFLFGQTNQITSNMNKIKKMQWAARTNTLHGLSFPADPQVKEALYTIRLSPNISKDMPVIAFKGAKSGKIWLGHKMDFYVETETNILGGYVEGGIVEWYNSLSTEETNVNDAIEHFDKNIDGLRLVLAGTPPDTDLRDVLPRSILGRNAPGDSKYGKLEVEKAHVEQEKIQLVLKNPRTGEEANVWIDLTTRMAMKP